MCERHGRRSLRSTAASNTWWTPAGEDQRPDESRHVKLFEIVTEGPGQRPRVSASDSLLGGVIGSRTSILTDGDDDMI